MEKNKLNQSLSLYDLISLILLMGTVIFVLIYILSRNMKDPQQTRAQSRAETLAQQIIFGGLDGLKLGQRGFEISRAPASLDVEEGAIGLDPWGRKYRYRIFESEDRRRKALAVWSDGPNKKRETTPEYLARQVSYPTQSGSFSGDDIGHFQFIEN